MLQMGAGALLLALLQEILDWATVQRPYVAPAAWMLAVDAAAGQQMPDAPALFMALKMLLDNVFHPMLILVGERFGWTTFLSPFLFAAWS